MLLDFAVVVAAAAPPAVPASGPPPESLTTLYALIGVTVLMQLVGATVGFFRWLGARSVQREDADKASMQAQLRDHELRIATIDKANVGLQGDIRQMVAAQLQASAEALRSLVSELKADLEKRFEKQNEFLEQRLAKMELDIRQDATRSMSDFFQRRTRKR